MSNRQSTKKGNRSGDKGVTIDQMPSVFDSMNDITQNLPNE